MQFCRFCKLRIFRLLDYDCQSLQTWQQLFQHYFLVSLISNSLVLPTRQFYVCYFQTQTCFLCVLVPYAVFYDVSKHLSCNLFQVYQFFLPCVNSSELDFFNSFFQLVGHLVAPFSCCGIFILQQVLLNLLMPYFQLLLV